MRSRLTLRVGPSSDGLPWPRAALSLNIGQARRDALGCGNGWNPASRISRSNDAVVKRTRWRGGSRPRQSAPKRRKLSASRFGVPIQSRPPGRKKHRVNSAHVASGVVHVLDHVTERHRVERAPVLRGVEVGEHPPAHVEPVLARSGDRRGIWVDALGTPSQGRHLRYERAVAAADVEETPTGVGGQVPDLPVHGRAARRRQLWTSEEIGQRALALPRKGFGSVRVAVTVGGSSWRTSIFPAAADRYDLPVKKAVRHAENLEPGYRVRVVLELVDL